ncbi:hypothetical protein M0813_18547 [Anaeramoeba flamelloides]|uniref:Reverse transcriptase domain-containing protein n=1 Tax=Anaeramoeba flamelloides TaxID=1746091 RepID=A0ABQ8YSL0_9EUKA|nr:hypothetical protein M0813_18547 [Anaeramoeba flamelloides]
MDIQDIFSLENIYDLIKYQKNKSVKDFDKIQFYKLDPKNKNEKDYLLFLKNIQRIFLHWIDNPNEEIINFIKERNILFIHKAGDEGVPLNYRPISINNSLARFFLKLIYKGIEDSWNLVSDSQFGFKKKLDTRIAVLNLLFELNKLKKKYKNKEFFIVTIDIKKCFDTISHILVLHALNKYIKNQKIKIWLQKYYKKEGIGVYQGDPLSPLMFGFISHFLIEKITDLVHHVQMFADDLILIMEGPISEIDKKLILIFKIIQEFGMYPNKDKTLKSNQLSEIKYLGIWLEKEKHLKKNFKKVKANFKKIKMIFSQQQLTNGVKLQMFKSIYNENINWKAENLKLLNANLNQFRENLIINSTGWKGQEYLKIIRYNNNINKQQKYLKWKGSTSILKLRNFTNYLNRYSYVYDKNKTKTKSCNLCKKYLNLDTDEDIDHFLWDCPFYKENRIIWIKDLIQINKNNKNNIFDIIRNKDSLFILSLVNDKENYDSLLRFLNKNLEIRAVRGN